MTNCTFLSRGVSMTNNSESQFRVNSIMCSKGSNADPQNAQSSYPYSRTDSYARPITLSMGRTNFREFETRLFAPKILSLTNQQLYPIILRIYFPCPHVPIGNIYRNLFVLTFGKYIYHATPCYKSFHFLWYATTNPEWAGTTVGNQIRLDGSELIWVYNTCPAFPIVALC